MNDNQDSILAVDEGKKTIRSQKLRAEINTGMRYSYGFIIAWILTAISWLTIDYLLVKGSLFNLTDNSFRYFNALIHLIVIGFIIHDCILSAHLKMAKILAYIDSKE